MELLVTIGIVAILAALLLPATIAARAMGQRATCMGNQRQLITGWLAYAADHNGRLISGDTAPTGWVLAGNSNSIITSGLLYPYVGNAAAYHCPSDTSNHVRSYSISQAVVSGTYIGVAHEMAQITQAADTLVFDEENDPRGYNWGSWWGTKSGSGWIDFVPSWHDGGINVSFADGHTEYWHFQDPRTDNLTTFYEVTPNDPDLARFQSVYKP